MMLLRIALAAAMVALPASAYAEDAMPTPSGTAVPISTPGQPPSMQAPVASGAQLPAVQGVASPGAVAPLGRAYQIDPQAEAVRFGDGVRGARPPAGAAPRGGYRYGSGASTSVPANAPPGAQDPHSRDRLRDLELQKQIQKKPQSVERASNAAKKRSDTHSSTIGNVK